MVPANFTSKILATIIMKGRYTNFSRIWVFILPFLSLITCDSDIDSYSSFSDVTNKIFGGPVNGTIAAFGDFNSDQNVDFFFIVNEGEYINHSFTAFQILPILVILES